MLKFKKYIIICLFFIAFNPLIAHASFPGPTRYSDAPVSDENNVVIFGQYINTGSLIGFLQLALVISDFILGLVGSLALLAFIVGGLMWLLSAGKAELVERGKQTILGAVIGLVVVFTSYMIIQLVFALLGIDPGQTGKWASSDWF